MTALGRYRALLAVPGVGAAVLLSVLCRLPMGMTPLALLLLVSASTGSFATAGLTTGVYAAAVAVASPLRARMVDRSGTALVMATSAVLHPLGLLGLLAAVRAGAPDAAVVALALLSGLAFPPVAAVMRALWASLAADDASRRTAFSLEAVLVETAFVLGPLGVSLALLAGSAGAAVVAAALLVAVGSAGLAASPLVRAWRPETGVPRRLVGPLGSRALRRLLAVGACLGAGIGGIEVAVPAFATAASRPAAAGLLIAVWGLGSIVGGLWYGGRDWAAPPAAQYPWLLGVLAAALALPLLAVGPVSLGVLLAVSGLAIAPVTSCNAALIARVAPAGTLTEAFGWSTTAIFGGVAVGTAAGGALVEAAGSTAALALAAASGAVGVAVGVRGRRLLADPVPVGTPGGLAGPAASRP